MKKLLIAAMVLCLSFSVILANDPAGSDKEIQYSISGVHAAEAGFEYDPATNTQTVEILNQPATAAPIMLMVDSTNNGEVQISASDAAGPDGVMSFEVDIAGTLTTIMRTDGINECVDIDYPLYLLERADAAADRAGYGQVWINTATPNELWWTDDAGTDVQLGQSGGLANVVEDTTPQLGADLEAQGFNLQNAGVLFLLEQADADADVTGEGQIWVNTATPNELWFTDDAGTDVQLGAAGAHSGTITWSGTSILESGTAFQFGDGTDATVTHTYANSGTDPTIAYSTDSIVITNAATFTVDGVAFQPLDSELTTIAGLTETRGDILVVSSGGAWADVAVGLATAILVSDGTDPAWDTTPALGTPSALVLTNATGLVAAGMADADHGQVSWTSNVATVDEVSAGAYAADSIDHDDLNDTLTFEDGTLLDFGTFISDATEGIMLPAHATTCASATGEGQVCWEEDAAALWIGDGSTAQQMNGAAPSTEVRSIMWNAGAMDADGTQCSDAVQTQLNSGPRKPAIICTDNDAGIIQGDAPMPDSYDGGTVTFRIEVMSDNATPADEFHVDFAVQCRGNSDIVNNTYGTEIAADVDFDASGTCGGSACVTWENAFVTTTAVTGNGTCAAGDHLYWQGSVDATGTTATVADVLILSVLMEYTSDIGD